MEIYLATQVIQFGYSILIGIFFGIIYDFLRCTRLMLNLSPIIIAIEDILFFIITAMICFLYLLVASDGQLRYFLLFGELIGATVYFLTISKIFMATADFLIKIMKFVLGGIIRIVFAPLNWLFSKIICPFIKKIKKIFANHLNSTKNTLKHHGGLVYNYMRCKNQFSFLRRRKLYGDEQKNKEKTSV